MNRIGQCLIAALVAVSPMTALAQDKADAISEEAVPEAWKAVHDIAGQYMSPKAISQLQLIAWHLAGEQFCDDVHTDPQKVGEAMLSLRPGNWDELDETKQKHWNAALATNFGIVLGVMIAEHAEETGTFCTEIAELKNDPEIGWHYFDLVEETSGDEDDAE